MKSNQLLAVFVAAAVLMPATLVRCAEISAVAGSTKAPQSKAEILPLMEKMAAAQLAQPAYASRAPADWVAGAFYVGLARLSHVSDDPKFVEAQKRIADQNQWQFQLARNHPGQGHADDECAGQMYIDLAITTKDLAKLEPMPSSSMASSMASSIPPTPRNAGTTISSVTKSPGPGGGAIPSSWPRRSSRDVSAVTGDKKYIDAMDKQWWFTYDRLYDKQEHLFLPRQRHSHPENRQRQKSLLVPRKRLGHRRHGQCPDLHARRLSHAPQLRAALQRNGRQAPHSPAIRRPLAHEPGRSGCRPQPRNQRHRLFLLRASPGASTTAIWTAPNSSLPSTKPGPR